MIPVERFVEGPPVALSLHVPGLDLPLLEEVGHPLGDVVVVHHVSEVVEGEVLYLGMIAIGEADHVRCAKVLVLAEVSGRHGLESIANQVPIEFHQHAHKSKVLRRDEATEARVRVITEGHVFRWLEPVVEAIDGEQCVELV